MKYINFLTIVINYSKNIIYFNICSVCSIYYTISTLDLNVFSTINYTHYKYINNFKFNTIYVEYLFNYAHT